MNRQILILFSLGSLLAYLLSDSGRRVTSEAGAWVADQVVNLRRGERLNNPGNVERGEPWQGLAVEQPDARFAAFTSPEWGYRAMVRILQTYAGQGLDTVGKIVARWAPATENPTAGYAATVARGMGVSINTILNLRDPETLLALLREMTRFEQGRVIYPDAVIADGIRKGLA